MTDPDPKSYNQPDRRTLTDADSGHLAASLIALTREVWVLADRIAVTEEILARRGMDIRAEIDAFQPDAQFQTKLNQMGERLVAQVVNALSGIETA
ncbi:hypothetical protein [Novosphingobium guangzhouense]|uniref:Uncharacterized protein n=1 Tax=Novosphingobium guangzhouense TaxID=1850347 RepID=A0A2K2G6H1_9SPHN|nr:hypothetical protein [Novosphingobium guangzhouense]PNU06637.1 hypothetical protein A8V01_00075 [Novosphingobium guangzhouense]